MCTGLEIAALAATAAGTYMQYDSQRDAQEAQQKAVEAEMFRQNKMDEEKYKNFQEALAEIGRGDQQENIDQAAEGFEEDYAANVNDPGEGSYVSPAASNTPKVVKQYDADQQKAADDFVSLLGNARARRGAWGENMYQFGQNMIDRQFDLGQLQTDMNRSAQIGEQEALIAGQPGMGAVWGNALAGLGTAGLGYAGGKEGAFGGLFDTAGNVSTVPVSTSTPTWTRNATTTGLGKNWWPKYNGTPL